MKKLFNLIQKRRRVREWDRLLKSLYRSDISKHLEILLKISRSSGIKKIINRRVGLFYRKLLTIKKPKNPEEWAHVLSLLRSVDPKTRRNDSVLFAASFSFLVENKKTFNEFLEIYLAKMIFEYVINPNVSLLFGLGEFSTLASFDEYYKKIRAEIRKELEMRGSIFTLSPATKSES